MLGIRAVYEQHNLDTEQMTDESSLDCGNLPDLARQEDKQKTDINYQLKMFGMDPFGPRIPQFGTVDYNLDLQNAMHATADARSAWKTLPAALQQKYGSWIDLLAAAKKGELDNIDLKTGLDKTKPEVNTSGNP